jgi:hypothetical protein
MKRYTRAALAIAMAGRKKNGSRRLRGEAERSGSMNRYFPDVAASYGARAGNGWKSLRTKTSILMVIARPEAIAPGLRQELTHYLLMGDAAAGGASGEVSTPA